MGDPNRTSSQLGKRSRSRQGFLAFRSGLVAPIRGFRFLLARPNLWLMAAVPVLWALVIAGIASTFAVMYLPSFASWLFGTGETWIGQTALSVLSFLVTGLGVLLSVVLGLSLAQPLSGPMLERLVRAFEKEIGAPARPIVPLWREVGRSAGGVLLGWAVFLPVFLVLSLVSMLLPPAVWITFPLKVLGFGILVTWDLMDYPFTVRGWSLRMRKRWIRNHLAAVVGFGFSLGIVLILPCIGLLLLPIGTMGAAWLFHEREQALAPPKLLP